MITLFISLTSNSSADKPSLIDDFPLFSNILKNNLPFKLDKIGKVNLQRVTK